MESSKGNESKGKNMNAWNKLDELTHMIGTQNVLNEMAQALSEDKLNEVLDYIIKNWDLDMEE